MMEPKYSAASDTTNQLQEEALETPSHSPPRTAEMGTAEDGDVVKPDISPPDEGASGLSVNVVAPVTTETDTTRWVAPTLSLDEAALSVDENDQDVVVPDQLPPV